MNIYEKIQTVKEKLLQANIKKSGFNKFAGYNYYELSDFTPYIIKLCNEVGLFTAISFDKELAKLQIINTEKTDEWIEYTSPMEDLELKGCNKVQALGGVETYSRRYLYMSAFDIIENDMFDATVNDKKEKDVSNELITQVKVQALEKAIENANITKVQVDNIINYFNYNKLEEIQNKDYMEICNRLKALKGA